MAALSTRIMLAMVLVAATLGAQANPDHAFRAVADSASPRIAALRADVAAGRRRAADEFWTDVRRRGAPLVEPSPGSPRHSLVTFLWRGTHKTRNAVIVDGVAAGVGGVDATRSQSSLELSEAPPLLPGGETATLAGTVETGRFASPASGNEYTAWVYLPPGFRRDGPAYPLIVVLDGTQYTTVIPGPAILDALIARGRIRPTVGVFVDTSFARAWLLSCSRLFSDVLATDIVPRARTAYHAGLEARDTAVAGSSLGGLASTCAAVTHPGVFGNVLSQSGSFWWAPDAEPEWLTRQVRQMPALPLRLFVEVGEMEIPQQLETNRRLRDALLAAAATVEYREFNGNHAYLPWRGGFADGLVSLFGQTPP
jgi:enterochelin esterase-like enzyme